MTKILHFIHIQAAAGKVAGPEHEVAVLPPAAQALLARYNARSSHYEVIERRGPE